ncbi:MAG: hypothetical protein KA161_07620 [Saprospiraceae bacterium]|nr:hypothetical protein [Saprospiraceae bacterium]
MSLQKKANIIYAVFILTLAGFCLCYFYSDNGWMSKSTTEVSKDKYHTNKTSKNLSPEIPDYVMEVLSYVQQNNQPLKGYVGGRRFFNREKKLPEQDNSGNKISYREWDVHPKKPNKNRGPERMVTSSNNKAYYTKNHYKDFIEIK